MNKKIISIALILSMLIGMLSIMPISIGAVDSNWLEIGSVSEWNDFTETAKNGYSGNVKLTANLDFNGETIIPATNDENGFNGTFDGQGYTMSNFNMKDNGDGTGIIGKISSGEVKNLVVKKATINVAQWSAVVVGEVDGTANVSNIYVDSDVTITATKGSTGGIVGGLYSSGNLTINDCVFAGTVVAAGDNLGGIVGNASGKPVAITNCLFLGSVTSTDGSKTDIGGIAGGNKNNSSSISNCISVGTAKTPLSDKLTAISNCYYIGQGLDNITDIIGSDAKPNMPENTWIKYNGDIMLPAGVASFAPPYLSWDGSIDTEFETEIDPETEDVIYLISSGAELAGMSKLVNEGTDGGSYRTAHYKLTADIALNRGDAKTWAETAPANAFSPIGIAADGYDDNSWRAGLFGGTFDGNGKTISGVYVNNETATSNNAGTGLFAIVGNNATVKNFIITNSYISANKAVGVIGLVRNASDLTISSIYSDIIVNAVEAGAGGIVGQLSGTGGASITNCVFAGTATAGSSIAGGILANGNGVNVSVTNCLNLGAVGASSYSSGIIGRNEYTCTVDRCVSVGTATYNFAASNKSEKKINVSNCYYIGTLSSKNTNDTDCVSVAISDLMGDVSDEITSVLSGWTERTDDIIVPTGVASFAPQWWYEPEGSFAGGDGTANTPYQIENADQLALMRDKVNNGTANTAHFEMTADITLNEDIDNPTNIWTPIGVGNSFEGTFNGNGKTISGLYMDHAGAGGAGLFANVSNGATVKNFALVNTYIKHTETTDDCGETGAIAAYISGTGATIDSIYVNATIESTQNNTGGIVGVIQGSKSTGTTITNCVFTGSISGTTYVGGIVGNGNNATLTVKNCLNLGDIESTGSHVSGIVGLHQGGNGNGKICTIENCVSIGSVNCITTDSVKEYGIVDNNKADYKDNVILKNCYYYMNSGKEASENTTNTNVNAIAAITEVIGNAATVTLDGWTKRANDVMIPTGCPVGTSTLMEAYLEYGASVRIDTSSEKTTGIRWTGIITDAYLAELAASGKNYSFGMIIAPVDYINSDFTKAELDKLDITTTKYKIVEAVNTVDCDGYVKFYCALGGIQENNLGREFAARIYVCVDGEYTYFNYNESANARSISYIAGAAFNDYKAEQTEGYENAITTGNSTIYSPYTEVQRNTLADYMFTADSTLATGASVRVMSLNILSDEYGDKLPVNGRDLAVEAIINEYNPAVIGLQETSANWYSSIKNLYNGTTYNICEPKCNSNFWDSLFGTGENYLTTIMYDSAQVSFVDSGVKEYSAERITQGNMIFWAKFTDKSGNTFVVINTHWDINKTDYAENRAAQAEELAAFIKTFDCPVIALGDFNTKTGDALFSDNGYEGDDATLNNARFTAETVITDWSYYDYIFGNSGVSFKAYNAIKDNVVEGASDHKPIYADIAFN